MADPRSELLVCTWRHGGHVGGQEQKHFSPLGTKLYFHVNFSRKYSFVLTPNMAAFSRGCKPRIGNSLKLYVLRQGCSVQTSCLLDTKYNYRNGKEISTWSHFQIRNCWRIRKPRKWELIILECATLLSLITKAF